MERKTCFGLVTKTVLLTVMMMLLFSVHAFAADTDTVNASLLNDINALRTSQGLSPLSLDASLNAVAATRAQEASVLWSHTRPDGTQGCDMISADKWRGENLSYIKTADFDGSEASWQSAADFMFDNLAASPSHYSNMVCKDFTKIGIYTYKTQDASGVKLTTAYMFSN